MKPRPIFPMFVVSAWSPRASATLQCRRNIHVRAIATALRPQIWYSGLQSTLQASNGKRWEPQRIQCASTSAVPARKTNHGSTAAPRAPAKATKTTVPAKPVPRKTSPPALVPGKPRTPTPTTAATLQARENLNPPEFTYPPEISVPAREPDQSRVKWLWKAGRAYVTFYKQGISNVRQTAKLAKSLRQKAAKTPDKDITEVLTRAEWQIVRRSKRDVLRLPIFGTLVLVLGEWLALVVMYLTPVIPEACRIPQQVQRTRVKLEARRSKCIRHIARSARRLIKIDPPTNSTTLPTANAAQRKLSQLGMKPKLKIDWMNRMALPPAILNLGDYTGLTLYELSLFAATNDCFPRLFLYTPFPAPKWLLLRNIRKKFAYINKDNALIERDGGWSALSKMEVERACVERSLPVVGWKEEDLRKLIIVTFDEEQWHKGLLRLGGKR